MIVYLTRCCISIFHIILLSSKNWKLKQGVQILLAVTYDRSTLGPSYKGRLLAVCGRKSFPVVCLWTEVVPCRNLLSSPLLLLFLIQNFSSKFPREIWLSIGNKFSYLPLNQRFDGCVIQILSWVESLLRFNPFILLQPF